MAKDFNWDKFDDAPESESAPAAQGFDWDQFEEFQEPSMLSKAASAVSDNISPALETAQDFSSGVAKGLSMGSLDELGGLTGATIETGLGKLGIGPAAVDQELAEQGFQVPQESFLEKYRGYQQASEKAQKEASERSPAAEVLGQIGGGVTGGSVLGGLLGLGKGAQGAAKLKDIAKDQGMGKAALELLKRGGTTYAKAAPAIAAESALTSEQDILGPESNLPGVAADVAGGLAFGLPAVFGLEAASELGPAIKDQGKKASKALKEVFESEDQPRLRQIAKAYSEYGKKLGVHPRSHGADIGELKLAQRDQKATMGVLDTLEQADDQLGKEVGESLQKATQRGALIDITPEVQGAFERVAELAERIPQLGQSRRSAQAYDKMLAGGGQLTPVDLKTLIDDIDASIGVFKSATNKNPAEASTLSELINFRRQISDSLKKNVTEYRDAASRFENFRTVLEQLISRDRPVEVTETFFGKLNKGDEKLYNSVREMVQNVQSTAASAQPARSSFSNFMDVLKDFEAKDIKRIEAGTAQSNVLPSSDTIRKHILDASDDSVLRGSSRATSESRALVPDLKEAVIGKAPTSAAYWAGKIAKKTETLAQKPVIKGTAQMSRAIYNLPAQTLSNVASRLESSGQFKNVGKVLRESLESGDSAKKNAALFTIMQNPNARAFISAEDLNENQEQ